MGFMVDKVALKWVFLNVLWFFYVTHSTHSFIQSVSQSFISHQCCIILTIVSVVILTHFKLLQCQKRGLNDYVQIGGSEGLDTTHLTVADSICGLNSKPGE